MAGYVQSAIARQRFRLWLAVVLPGIPLLAYWGLNDRPLWIMLPFLALAYWLHRRIHACPSWGWSHALTTPHLGAPVLYFCRHRRTFFEHGEIDGG